MHRGSIEVATSCVSCQERISRHPSSLGVETHRGGRVAGGRGHPLGEQAGHTLGVGTANCTSSIFAQVPIIRRLLRRAPEPQLNEFGCVETHQGGRVASGRGHPLGEQAGRALGGGTANCASSIFTQVPVIRRLLRRAPEPQLNEFGCAQATQ
jgi:hypothetical protein